MNEAQDVKHHTFRSVANWGENLPGNWTVKITDWFTGDVGTVNHLSGTFHGYGEVVTEASHWELYE